ncbi:hypothetical protein NOM03_11795, partial [Proteus terrae]|uniref:hypothetical protein n=1 Tax=Proteus terrae TaxID=1574161 RepID=UPI0021AD656C
PRTTHCNYKDFIELDFLLVFLVIFFFTRNNNWCNIANRQFYFLILLIRCLILIFIPHLEFTFLFSAIGKITHIIIFFRERGYA